MMIKRDDEMEKFMEIIREKPDTEKASISSLFFLFFYDGLTRTEEFVASLAKREIGTFCFRSFVRFSFFFFSFSDVLPRKTLVPGFSRGSPPSGTRSNEKIYKSSSRNRDPNVSKCPPGEVRNNPRTLLEKISSGGRMASSARAARN